MPTLDILQQFEADEYVCTLNENLTRTAQLELREVPHLREQALESMRIWINKKQHIIKCRMDANFLLRFLRTKKFSIPIAQETLDKYIAVRLAMPEIFQNLDTEDPILAKLIDNGAHFPLPGYDKLGRKVIISKSDAVNPNKHHAYDVMKLVALTMEILMEDESNQINGCVYVYDTEGSTMAHMAMWGLPVMKKAALCWEKAIPVRNKGFHYMNMAPFIVTCFDTFKSLMNDKIGKRTFVHRNSNILQEFIPLENLPEEYGGKLTTRDIIDDWKMVLHQKRDMLLALDQAFVLDERKRVGNKEDPYGLNGIQGSFRQLEID